jgi:polysulfide reductase-like protein
MSTQADEQRLDELREEARTTGAVSGRGVEIAGGPIPRMPGYYGQPVIRPPVWTWEIPVYFFTGGLCGMAAAIAAAALIFHHPEVARSAMWICGAGIVLCPGLLILDLGRPRLFMNMLRVFKPQSAMSMGVWILFFFAMCVAPGLMALELHHFGIVSGVFDRVIQFLGVLFICASAILGVLLATYTGVLIGATAIPAWFLHRTLLPAHFGIAGLGSAAGLLELLGHRIPALNGIGLCAAAIETLLTIWLFCDKHAAADRALHQGGAAWLIRIAGFSSGPISLALRLLGLLPAAAAVFLLGSYLSRVGWLRAGKVSGADGEAVFASQR